MTSEPVQPEFGALSETLGGALIETFLMSAETGHEEFKADLIVSLVETLPLRDAENILFRNAARLYDFDLDYLAANKHEVAPPS